MQQCHYCATAAGVLAGDMDVGGAGELMQKFEGGFPDALVIGIFPMMKSIERGGGRLIHQLTATVCCHASLPLRHRDVGGAVLLILLQHGYQGFALVQVLP